MREIGRSGGFIAVLVSVGLWASSAWAGGALCANGLCDVANAVGIEFVRIEGGTFNMGSDSLTPYETPVHAVTVPTFLLAKTEVTVGQYRACVQAGGCTAPDKNPDHWDFPWVRVERDKHNWGRDGREQHPINGVDWHQAQAFATWVKGDRSFAKHNDRSPCAQLAGAETYRACAAPTWASGSPAPSPPENAERSRR